MNTIDVRNQLLPFSLLTIHRAARQMAAGEALEVRGGNPELAPDLVRICPPPDYEVLPPEPVRSGGGFRLQIRKCG